LFTAPVPNPARVDTVLSKMKDESNIVAMQRSDAGAIFFTDDHWFASKIFGSRTGADGSPIDPKPYPIIDAPLSAYYPTPLAVVGDALYWRDETMDSPRLMRSPIVLSPQLKAGAPTEIDLLAPIAVAATSRNLYLVYESMYALYLRTYSVSDPVFTPRRRVAR